MSDRKTWTQICRREDLSGLWVALDRCRYDQDTLQPIEGEVVDSDADLARLCARMRESDRSSCAIRFCDGAAVATLPRKDDSSPYASVDPGPR